MFVSRQLPGEGLRRLSEVCELKVWPDPGPISPELLRSEMSGVHGLLCMLTDRIDRDLIASLPELEFVSSMSVGVDHIDVDAMTNRKLPVGHTPGVLVETTADTAFALLLAAARRIAESDRFIRHGQWSPSNVWSPDFFVGKDLGGATLGIIGLGEIGKAVARRATGFGMKLVASNRSAVSMPGIDILPLEELLASSDFISVHVALTDDTRNLLSADRIALIKPGAVLVNTARGGIIDESALAQALTDGRLSAAGIDVFSEEPITRDNPLLNLPNVVLTPHIGSASVRTRSRMADMAVANAIAALAGQTMPCCVNPQVYD
ncbi:MAG: D-glycerate dehydrogenase [Pseudomonadota bacterium]